MTVEEIFSKLCTHMIKGLMFHQQMGMYYHFLNLEGYKCCHEYHYLSESLNHLKLQKYYINKYNKLIPEAKFENPAVIPEAWYGVTRQDVGTTTKRTAIKDGVASWLKWEKDTCNCYNKLYQELISLEEVTAACMVKELMLDVEEEIQYAERKQLELSAIDYSLDYICEQQKELYDKFKEKKKKLLK